MLYNVSMTKVKTVPVSQRALFQRIYRRLQQDGQLLRAARGLTAREQYGDYFTINVKTNTVTRTRVNLEALGKELGVLQPWEAVEKK